MLRAGEVFAGRYRVQRRLAQGGMGVIYVAEHLSTEEQVALKVLWPHVLGSKAAVESFQLEARLAARIGSEHTVRITDAGFDAKSGMPFLAMELLRGATLRALVTKQRPLSPLQVITIVRQAAKALDKAHGHVDREGRLAPIVHRDLKPENVFVALREGAAVAKVLDFGIAKVLSENVEQSQGVRGTPLFMASEQIIKGPVTPRIDVWAIGLIVFYLLTGHNYWLASTQGAEGLVPLLSEILAQPIVGPTERARAFRLAPGWGPAFDAWFLQCVNRKPEARFSSAGVAAAALESALTLGAKSSKADNLAARSDLFRRVTLLLDPSLGLPLSEASTEEPTSLSINHSAVDLVSQDLVLQAPTERAPSGFWAEGPAPPSLAVGPAPRARADGPTLPSQADDLTLHWAEAATLLPEAVGLTPYPHPPGPAPRPHATGPAPRPHATGPTPRPHATGPTPPPYPKAKKTASSLQAGTMAPLLQADKTAILPQADKTALLPQADKTALLPQAGTTAPLPQADTTAPYTQADDLTLHWADVATPQPQATGPAPRAWADGPTPRPWVDGPTPRPWVDGPTPRPWVDGPTPRPWADGPTPRPWADGPTPGAWADGPTPLPGAREPLPSFAEQASVGVPQAKVSFSPGVAPLATAVPTTPLFGAAVSPAQPKPWSAWFHGVPAIWMLTANVILGGAVILIGVVSLRGSGSTKRTGVASVGGALSAPLSARGAPVLAPSASALTVVAAEPSAAGQNAAEPSAAGPNAAEPSAAGRNAAGPSAAGSSVAGRNAVGSRAAGRNAVGPNGAELSAAVRNAIRWNAAGPSAPGRTAAGQNAAELSAAEVASPWPSASASSARPPGRAPAEIEKRPGQSNPKKKRRFDVGF